MLSERRLESTYFACWRSSFREFFTSHVEAGSKGWLSNREICSLLWILPDLLASIFTGGVHPGFPLQSRALSIQRRGSNEEESEYNLRNPALGRMDVVKLLNIV